MTSAAYRSVQAEECCARLTLALRTYPSSDLLDERIYLRALTWLDEYQTARLAVVEAILAERGESQ